MKLWSSSPLTIDLPGRNQLGAGLGLARIGAASLRSSRAPCGLAGTRPILSRPAAYYFMPSPIIFLSPGGRDCLNYVSSAHAPFGAAEIAATRPPCQRGALL